jgi:pyruvate,water dikinase
LLRLLVHPQVLVHLYRLLFQITRHPERAAGVLAHTHAAWRDRLLPQYRALIETGEQRVQHASPTALCRLVDAVGDVAGAYLWSMGTLAGSAWKMEAALARFHRTYLAGHVDCSHQVLLCGLPGTEPDPAPHAVFSADWFWPTAGEGGASGAAPSGADRHRALADRRATAEAACRVVLASTPTLRQRFDRLLDMAQRAAVIRELQTRLFTLGWPLLRRCALRLGELLRDRGVIAQGDDAFFLTREELSVLLRDGDSCDLRPTVASRRMQWARHRQLAAPLDIGSASHPARKYLARLIEQARATPARRDGRIVGHPASPGRASGPVRLVLGPGDFDRFEPGEVLVARATTPAWTPLFARAAAVVTDGGSLAAHASLVAREYGIPAVVATGDATHRLCDGQVVTVDGGAGMVELVQGA